MTKIGCVPVFVKRGAPVAIEREAAVLRHIQRARCGRTPIAPAVLACDGSSGRLYVEAFRAWQTLHELFIDGGGDQAAQAALLGRRLAALHTVDPGGLPAATSHVPKLDLTPLEASELCGETLALIGYLQGVPDLQERFAELRCDATERALVHGDMKLDNVLCGPGGELVLVDFEDAGAGDRAWDVGAAVGDYLSRWLLSSRCDAGRPLPEWLRDAAVPLQRCGAAGRELLAGYASARSLPDLDRIAAGAGVFLMHRAQAWIERYHRFGAKAMLLARCGGGLVVGRWRSLEPLLGSSR